MPYIRRYNRYTRRYERARLHGGGGTGNRQTRRVRSPGISKTTRTHIEGVGELLMGHIPTPKVRQITTVPNIIPGKKGRIQDSNVKIVHLQHMSYIVIKHKHPARRLLIDKFLMPAVGLVAAGIAGGVALFEAGAAAVARASSRVVLDLEEIGAGDNPIWQSARARTATTFYNPSSGFAYAL